MKTLCACAFKYRKKGHVIACNSRAYIHICQVQRTLSLIITQHDIYVMLLRVRAEYKAVKNRFYRFSSGGCTLSKALLFVCSAGRREEESKHLNPCSNISSCLIYISVSLPLVLFSNVSHFRCSVLLFLCPNSTSLYLILGPVMEEVFQ